MKIDWSKIPIGTTIRRTDKGTLVRVDNENDEIFVIQDGETEAIPQPFDWWEPVKDESFDEFQKNCLTVTALDEAQFQKALERYRELLKVVAVSDNRHALVVAINSVGGIVQEGIN